MDMSKLIDKSMENGLVKLVNSYLCDTGVYLENYQRIDLYIYEQNIIDNLIKQCKFKDAGNVYDYPELLPQPEAINGYDLNSSFDLFQRVVISKKFNSVGFYTADTYSICCTFLVDIDKLKKFSKTIREILKHDSHSNIFRDTDFKCESSEYIEITDAVEDKTKPVDVIKKKVPVENLVFDEGSAISDVMNDIGTFFKKDTHKLYEKLELPYKRGIILFGDPGNGKSAMIREIIRTVPDITKVLINPNVINVTRILQSLTKALENRHAIIIIEDIDSLITDRNRSEFLNILDGVDIRSGIYFIGTTNYPDAIDPAFMNRSGRFDRTYKIDNPSEHTRKLFFESRKLGKLLSEYKVYKNDSKPDSDEGVIDVFIKNSCNLPMASLKELITSTSYLLAANVDMTVEDAVEKSFQTLSNSRNEHAQMHQSFMNRNRRPPRYYDDDDN